MIDHLIRFPDRYRLVCLVLLLCGSLGDARDCAAQEPTFWNDIYPIVRKHCAVCHAEKFADNEDIGGGLVLASYKRLVQSDSPLIVPGKASESRLVQVLLETDPDLRMPLDGDPLPSEVIARIKAWINGGAVEGKPPEKSSPVAKPRRRTWPGLRSVSVAAESHQPELRFELKVGPLPAVSALAFSSTGKLLAIGTQNQITLWGWESGRVEGILDFPGKVHDLLFADGDKALIAGGGSAGSRGTVQVFDVGKRSLRREFSGHDDSVFGIAFDETSKRIASAGLDKKIVIWGGEAEPPINLTAHTDAVFDVAFAKGGSRLLSCGRDRAIKVFDTGNWEVLRTIGGHTKAIHSLALTADGGGVLSAGADPDARWNRIEDGAEDASLIGHEKGIHEITSSSDGQWILTASGDGAIRLWGTTFGEDVWEQAINGQPVTCVFHPGNRLVVAGTQQGWIGIWKLEDGAAVGKILVPPCESDEPAWWVSSATGVFYVSDRLKPLLKLTSGGEDLPDSEREALQSDNVVEQFLGSN